MINILTRTYNRPNYFKICHESIRIQDEDNVHIVAYDDEKTLSYLREYPDIILVSVPKQIKTAVNTFPYNLYFNEMILYVIDGYIIYLDDDDSLCPNALQTIKEHLDINTLIIWRVQFPNGLYPRDNVFKAKRITSSGFPSNCFCFHHSWTQKVDWTGQKGGDSIFLNRISKIIPNKIWIDKVLAQINQESCISGMGKGNDIM